ncbi:MAG: hypothetical protein ABIW33_00870 [Sphingomicrobium sp.]
MSLLWISAALMGVTAITHSWLGEVKLVGPMLRGRSGVLRNDFARVIVRYAWHVTSALMLASALTISWPGAPRDLVRAIGGIWIALGLVSLVASRAKHVGWPILGLAGIMAVIGA